jgi:glycerate 2-kinase
MGRMTAFAADPVDVLRALFDQAVRAVMPETCLARYLPSPDWPGRTVLISVGKAGAAMADVATAHFGPDLQGLVVIPPGHGVEVGRLADGLDVIEAGHPVPNAHSLRAADQALEMAQSLNPGDRMIALISGGGSALLARPVEGVSLDDKRALTKALLASGATISQMNCVRASLSRIKGGRLALAAAPARVETFVISDIPGDDPALVASGPTVPAAHSLQDARAIIEQFCPHSVTPTIKRALDKAAMSARECKGEIQSNTSVTLIASADQAFQAAIGLAQKAHLETIYLGDRIEGESRELGQSHGQMALSAPRSTLILSGGETTVSLALQSQADARGGRNLEYLLSLAIALDGAPDIYTLACDTDGIDGASSGAGAIITPTTLKRARAIGLDPGQCLRDHQSHLFFEALGDLVVTGPTRTNVNDFRAILKV